MGVCVTTTGKEYSWMQMGLHSEVEPKRNGRAVQDTIGGQMVQPDVWHRL
jgi:hypothetical protein